MLAKIAVTAGLLLSFGAPAANATPSLRVAVTPAKVRPGGRYTVRITGRYNKRTRPKPPYVVAFVQYTGQACQPTATAEYRLPNSQWSWDIYPRPETASPFKVNTYWKAGPSLGYRRVCAYMYADPVTPSTTATPLTRASATFRNVKR